MLSRPRIGSEFGGVASMDFRFTPEEDAFRAKIHAWLEATTQEVYGRGQDGPGASTASLMDVADDSRWQRLRQYHRRLYEAGYAALHWPKEFGGGGATLIEQAIYQDEALSFGMPLYGCNQLAARSRRSNPDVFGYAGAKRSLPAQDDDRRGNLVPGLLRAQRRIRSCGLADSCGRRRRFVRRQRAKSLDEPGASRRLAGAAGADRYRSAQTQGHLVPAGGHEDSRNHGAPAGADYRRRGFQRGLLRQCPRAQGKSRRRN